MAAGFGNIVGATGSLPERGAAMGQAGMKQAQMMPSRMLQDGRTIGQFDPTRVNFGRGAGMGQGGMGGPQYNPMQPTGNFNVNQAAAGGLQTAMQGTAAAMGYQPQQVRGMGYNPAQIAGQNLSAYTNPYESQVVGQALGDIERQRQMQQNQLGAQASAARAFGGSRQGIAEAETNRAFAQQAADTASQLRQAGYAQAQNLAGQDVAAQNVAGQFGAQQNLQAQLANQSAGLQGAQLGLSAAGQMGQLGNQAFQTGQAINQQQMQQGAMQQMLQQSLIDAARGQYAGFTGAPGASLNAPLAALGVAPYGQSTTQTQQPGLFNYMSMLFGGF